LKRFYFLIVICILFILAFEGSRLYFVLYHLKAFDEGFFMSFLRSAWHGFSMDLSATAYCVLPLFLLLMVEYIIKKPLSVKWYQFIIGFELILIALISIVDAELYLHWGNRFNNQILVYASHPKEMLLSAGSANWFKSISMGFGLGIIFFGIYKSLIKAIIRPMAYSWQYAVVTLFCMGLNFIALRGGIGVSTMSPSRAIYDQKSINNAAALNAFWNTLYYCFNDANTLYGDGFKVASSEIAKQYLDSACTAWPDTLRICNVKQPNILIIVLESFTASASQLYTGHNRLTPNLDAYAKQHLAFMNCYASGDRTDKGIVAINSGYPAQPLSSIIIFPDKVAKLNSLSKHLKGIGYSTAFVYGGDADFASMKSYCVMQGFQHIFDKRAFASDELNSKWGAHDGVMFSKTLKVINGLSKPFYTLGLTLSSHEPFDVPYTSKVLRKGTDQYAFKNAIEYTDYELGLFLKACEQASWYDSTLIVLVADHGHDIGVPNVEFFGKEKFHIPLVIGGGALNPQYKGKALEQYVSQTILPGLLLQAMHQSVKGFEWQTTATDPNGFAQFHYNNGFGRICQSGFLSYYNENHTYGFKGDSSKLQASVRQGVLYQQALIDDFIQK